MAATTNSDPTICAASADQVEMRMRRHQQQRVINPAGCLAIPANKISARMHSINDPFIGLSLAIAIARRMGERGDHALSPPL
jgi:hypothetical protein